jgi:hypothetical protein
MDVYGISRVRTDTTKEPDALLSIWYTREEAQGHCDTLNKRNSQDPYNVYRYRVEVFTVQGTLPN